MCYIEHFKWRYDLRTPHCIKQSFILSTLLFNLHWDFFWKDNVSFEPALISLKLKIIANIQLHSSYKCFIVHQSEIKFGLGDPMKLLSEQTLPRRFLNQIEETKLYFYYTAPVFVDVDFIIVSSFFRKNLYKSQDILDEMDTTSV